MHNIRVVTSDVLYLAVGRPNTRAQHPGKLEGCQFSVTHRWTRDPATSFLISWRVSSTMMAHIMSQQGSRSVKRAVQFGWRVRKSLSAFVPTMTGDKSKLIAPTDDCDCLHISLRFTVSHCSGHNIVCAIYFRDHYFLNVAWRDASAVMVAWANRVQNATITTLCNVTLSTCIEVWR